MEINAVKKVKIDVQTMAIHMKVCDGFAAVLKDQDNETIKDYEGYVPIFMPGPHYGDYLILDIDIDTGQILNWKKPSQEQLEDFINAEE